MRVKLEAAVVMSHLLTLINKIVLLLGQCVINVSLRWDHLALLLLCALLPAHTPTAMGFYVFGKLISPRKRSYFILDFFANSLWPLFWPAFLACSTLSLIFKRFRLR